MPMRYRARRDTRGVLVDRLLSLADKARVCAVMPPLSELAMAYGVCERTIRRDLEAIERRYPIRWRQEDR